MVSGVRPQQQLGAVSAVRPMLPALVLAPSCSIVHEGAGCTMLTYTNSAYRWYSLARVQPSRCMILTHAIISYLRCSFTYELYLRASATSMPAARSELVRAHVACMCARACSLMPCDTYTCQQLVLAVGSRSRGLRGMTLMYANSCVTLSHASSSMCSRACSLVQHEADTYEQHVRAVLERTCGTRPRSCSPRAV